MATTKRSKGGRAAVTRGKATARGRAGKHTTAKRSAPRPAVKGGTSSAKARTAAKSKAVAKPRIVTKPKAAAPRRSKPVRSAPPKRPTAKPAASAVVDNAEIVALKHKFQRERGGLERRLTDAVREIGLLRHHELRAMQLERQLAEREATIARLQTQLADLERRPAETVYVHEVQQTLALGITSTEHEAEAPNLDEFEEERLVDDGDLTTED